MNYTAKPGSVADRALAVLQSQPPAGAELSTAALAEALGVNSTSIAACMQPALEAGAVYARKKGGHARSPLFWSLVDHTTKQQYASTGEAFSPANGSQAPDGDAAIPPARAGRNTRGRGSQHVVKATAARPDATDREIPANPSRVGGPMGTGQPAAAGPAGDIRVALWSDGTLQIERPGAVGGAAALVLFSADETRALVRYLDRTLTANTEEITS